MTMNTHSRHRWRAQLQRLTQAAPEIKHSILVSGGGVVVAWPLRPVLRIVGLAATTPEMLALLRRPTEQIEDSRLGGTIARMRGGWLATIAIDDQLSLKLLFSVATVAGASVEKIVKTVDEIRAVAEHGASGSPRRADG